MVKYNLKSQRRVGDNNLGTEGVFRFVQTPKESKIYAPITYSVLSLVFSSLHNCI
jgi:hypothetical protein